MKDILRTSNTVQKNVMLSLRQTIGANGIMRCRGSHTVQTIDSQMAVRLSALHAGRASPPPGKFRMRLEGLSALKKLITKQKISLQECLSLCRFERTITQIGVN
jgi:hypothetical protein